MFPCIITTHAVGAAVQPLADAAWEAATRELAQVCVARTSSLTFID